MRPVPMYAVRRSGRKWRNHIGGRIVPGRTARLLAVRARARRRGGVGVVVIACLALVTLGSPAEAQNLLSNPEVIGTTAPWTVCSGSHSVFDDHTETCTDSGSVLTGSALVGCGAGIDPSFNQFAIFQCVALAGTGVVAGSSEVFYRAWVLVNRQEATVLSIRFFSSSDCTGSEISGALESMLTPGSQWVFYPLSAVGTPVPATTASIELRMAAYDPIDDSPFFGALDAAYLGTVPLLFDDGLDHTSSVACNWSSYSP